MSAGQVASFLTVLAVLLPSPLLAAQEFAEQWSPYEPPQHADGRPGTWLDQLRQNNRQNDYENDPDLARDPGSENEFDLPDFFEEPLSDSNSSGAMPPFDTGTLSLIPVQAEPAEPSPVFDPVPDFNEAPMMPDRPAVRQITPEALFYDGPPPNDRGYTYQILPKGLLYRTYLAGEKEPRLQFLHLYDSRSKTVFWDAVLGGRAGLLRYGTVGPARTEAFQLDLEGAVFARCLPSEPSAMLMGSDYRVGLFGTWKFGQTAWKAGYYHISSHVGDEYLLANPLFNRINYVRDSLLAGISHDLSGSTRIYGEIGYAPGIQGGARPLEFQSGMEYSPVARSAFCGAPFLAVNGHLREDFDFGGGINVVSGWGWQGRETGHRLRVGLNYYYGPSLQYEFFDRRENLLGGGVWLDF